MVDRTLLGVSQGYLVFARPFLVVAKVVVVFVFFLGGGGWMLLYYVVAKVF